MIAGTERNNREPERADAFVFGRSTGPDRGGFLPAAARGDVGGLPEGPGCEEMFYTCNQCHALRTVTARQLRRWEQLMDRMVTEQGMVEPEPDTRVLIVDDLVEHYGVPDGG